MFEIGHFSGILSMVSAVPGVSVLPETTIEHLPGCRFVPLADERAARTIEAITLGGKSSTRLHEAFLSHPHAQVRMNLGGLAQLIRFSAYFPRALDADFTAEIQEFVRASSTSSGSAPPLSISS